ncbi:ATP-binding protein [Kitasatospora sp. NPDC054939]
MDGASRHWHLLLAPTDGPGAQHGMAFVRRALAARTDTAPLDHRLTGDALLVACELLTNAYEHTPGPLRLDLDLDLVDERLTVAVTDASPRRPVVRPYRPHRPGGHGLHIVDRLATDWGVTPRVGGKTVWAVVPSA